MAAGTWVLSTATASTSGTTSPLTWKTSMTTAGVTNISWSQTAAGASTGTYSINMATAPNALKISTGAGKDTIVGTNYADTIFSGGATTTATDVGDIITGGAGNDTINGGLGADTFNFSGDFGADTIALGGTAAADSQTYKFSGISFSDLTFSLDSKTDAKITTTDGSSVLLSAFVDATAVQEKATFITSDKSFHLFTNQAGGSKVSATTGADYILVSGSTTVVNGKGGADTMVGGAGNEVFMYKTGIAKITGGAGTDTVTASTATAAVTLDLFNTSLYSGVEVAMGGSGNDLIRSSTEGGESLNGGAGKDNIWSNGGADTIQGGAGIDTYWFQSGDGADTVIACTTTANADVFNFKNLAQSDLSFALDASSALDVSYAGDSVHISGFAVTTAGAEQKNTLFQTSDNTFHVFKTTTAAAVVTGTTTNDYINVSSDTAGVTITSKAGADTIIGGAGDDIINFTTTMASLNGGEGVNTLTANTSTVAVDLNLADAKYSKVTVGIGSSYNDVLRGNGETADSLNGGIGADHIWGRAGNDTLTGGGGADTFWFGTGDEADTITDGTSLDAVKMYNAPVTSQSLSGGDLVLNIADGSSLTITGWESATSKLNKFEYNGTLYKLNDDATVWSKA